MYDYVIYAIGASCVSVTLLVAVVLLRLAFG
jgi:hypothetical protein